MRKGREGRGVQGPWSIDGRSMISPMVLMLLLP